MSDKVKQIVGARHTEHMVDPIKYNNDVREAWQNIWVRNAARNYSFIEKLMEERDVDILALPRKANKPVLILASGPSLDDLSPHIKDWEGDVWCSTSQLSWLEYHEVEPTVCVYIDADPSQGFLITEKYREPHDTILITHPCMPREMLEAWGGPVYFFRMHDPGDDFSTKYLPAMYGGINAKEKRWLKSYVLNAGCVANAMCALAQAFGYGPIFLCGYDLGYPDGIRRFRNYYREGEKWVDDQPMLPPDRPVFPGNNGVTTDELSCFYKYSFMIFYGLGCPPIISCSRGTLSELPNVPIKEVVEKQGEGFTDLYPAPLEVYRRAQTYLKYRGIHIVRSQRHVETANETGMSIFKKLLVRFAFWRMDEFTRMVERGRPSLYRKIEAFVRRGGPYVIAEDGSARHWKWRKSADEEGSGEGGGHGGKPELPTPPGYPEAPAVQEHPSEQRA